MKTYVLATGDYPNIGDALIRRRALEWSSDWTESRTVYVGPAPDMWIRQIGTASTDRILRGRWGLIKLYLFVALGRSRPVLFFEPGEVTLTGTGETIREFGYLVLTALARLRGGYVVRPLRGVRGRNRLGTAFHRFACTLSQRVLWRNEDSRTVMRRGEVGPDIAFASDIRQSTAERELLVVTTRGPRPHPGDAWLSALKAVSAELGLRILVISQVRQDEQRAREHASQLGAELLEWGAEDDIEREQRLREVYDRASIVVSDRLHVLILASLSGAIPVEAVPNPACKIRTHFGAIGYHGPTLDTSGRSATEIVAHVIEQSRRGEELRSAVEKAHADVLALRASVYDDIVRRGRVARS